MQNPQVVEFTNRGRALAKQVRDFTNEAAKVMRSSHKKSNGDPRMKKAAKALRDAQRIFSNVVQMPSGGNVTGRKPGRPRKDAA